MSNRSTAVSGGAIVVFRMRSMLSNFPLSVIKMHRMMVWFFDGLDLGREVNGLSGMAVLKIQMLQHSSAAMRYIVLVASFIGLEGKKQLAVVIL